MKKQNDELRKRLEGAKPKVHQDPSELIKALTKAADDASPIPEGKRKSKSKWD